MVRAIVGICGLVATAVLAAGPGRASLYQPDDPMAVPVRPDGTGEPLPFDQFKLRMVTLGNMLNPGLKNSDGSPTDRGKVLARIKTRQQARTLPPDEVAALAADLLRVGQSDEAVNRLKPLYDDRDRKGTRTYAVCAAVVHAHAARGEWDQALNYLPDLFDAPPPAEVKGITPAQRDWQAKLDRDYLPHYLHLRKAEAAQRPVPEAEEPTPLFPLPAREHPTDPVRFVNDAGQYEPGKLAAAERAKLPPDAVAVVQQLLLWFPADTRLYWLLAELYAADDKLDEAQKVLDECAWSKQYGNRKVMMDHRTAIAGAIAAREKAAEQAREAAMPISLRTVLIYFGVVAAVGVLAVVRALARRGGHCNPGG